MRDILKVPLNILMFKDAVIKKKKDCFNKVNNAKTIIVVSINCTINRSSEIYLKISLLLLFYCILMGGGSFLHKGVISPSVE